MSQVVTELVIDYDSAPADRFSSDMGRSGESAKGAVSSAAGLSLAIAGVGVAFVGALVGLRSFFDYVGQQNKQLIDIAENARNAGMTTRDFQETLFAARSKGLTEKDFVSGLDKISTDLTAASAGVTEFGRLFEANGLKIKNSNGELKNSKQALADIAGLMENASPTIQLGIAKIVGLSKEWIPFLRDGVDAIEAQKKAAADLGVIIDGDVIAKAKEFDKQWKTAIAAWDLQFKASLSGILPLLIQLANAAAIVLNAINAVGGTVSRWSTPLDQMSGSQLKDQLSDVEALRAKMLDLKTSQDAVTDSLKKQNEESKSIDLSLLDLMNIKNELQLKNKKSMLLGDGDADLTAVDAMIARIKRLLELKERFEGLPTITVGSTVLPDNDNNDVVDRAINTLTRHIERQKADTEAIGLGSGALALFRAQAAETAAVLANKGKETDEQRAKFAKLKEEAFAVADAYARMKVASQIDFNLKTAFLSPEDLQIANQLKDIFGNNVAGALVSAQAEAIRFTNAIKGMRDDGVTFATDFVHGLESGKSIMDSLAVAADNLGKKLIDAGLTRGINLGLDALTGASAGGLGAISGSTALTASATAAAAAITTAGASAGASIAAGGAAAAAALGIPAVTLPVAGATAGTEVAAGGVVAGTALAAGGTVAGVALWGPIAAFAAILVGIGLMSASGGGEAKLKAAQEEWKKAGPEFQKFLTEMSGGVQGNLSQQIQDAAAREADFEDKAWKARDIAAVNAARTGLQNFSDRQKLLFQATFQATVDALNDGLGLDSPFMKAVNNVKTALNNQLAFIDDTNVAIGDNIPGTMAKAKAASQSYLVSLLQQPRALSAVQTGMMQIHGTANALQGALVQLGLSSADTATAINDGVTKAVAGLKTQFEAGLTERLNTANGQSFLNDATKLIQQHQQDILDAASLGTDPSLVAATFKAEAQQIVDSASLVGDAFTSFKTQFPELATVVHEFTASAVADSKALRDAQNSAAKNLTDFLANLQAGPGSTQSPIATLASAQTLYQANLPLAQAGNVDAQNKFVSLADNLEKAARVVYASGQGYQDIRNQIINQGLALPAVVATTDPVTAAVRDAILAIQVGNAALSVANGNTTGLILPAVNAGNAVAVAANLAAYFNNLSAVQAATTGAVNSGTGQLVPAVNAGNAASTAAALTGLFNQIDPTGRLAGILSYSGNIASFTEGTKGYTGYLESIHNTSLPNVKGAVDQDRATLEYSNIIFTAIMGLQTTATAQLTLLTASLSPTVVSVHVSGSGNSAPALGGQGSEHDYILSNQVVTALNKIAINTYILTQNTAYTEKSANYAGDELKGHGGVGTYALGGVIPAHGLGLVSEHLNPTWVRAGAEPITVSPFSAMSSGNDNFRPVSIAAPQSFRGNIDNGNAALLAEVKQLNEKIDRLERVVAGSGANVARAVVEAGEKDVEATDRQTDTLASTRRLSDLKRKVANG